MSAALILTSTVIVSRNLPCLHQVNPKSRIDVYIKSVRQWLNKSNFTIILVENSGYTFEELNEEKEKYKNRFEVITYKECDLKEALYLKHNFSKGAHEMFAIQWAFTHSKNVHKFNFIIKITARYFIQEFERYLNQFDLEKYDCLRQHITGCCEIVGSHIKNFSYIFDLHLIDSNQQYIDFVEKIFDERIARFKKPLICKKLEIEATARGGIDELATSL